MLALQRIIPRCHYGRLSRAEYEERYDLNHVQRFEAALNLSGRSLRDCKTILDFGCGVGRLTRHLFHVAPQAKITGCDPQPQAVSVCRRRFPQGEFIQNDPQPPLSFADNQFDLIFSYSVFTHLSETNHKAWLPELSRLLKPRGVMVHSVQSHEALKRKAMFSPNMLKKYALPESIERFIQEAPDYYYQVDNPRTPEYGLTIIRKGYIQARWPQYTGLILVAYLEAAIEAYPEGCHDLVVLAKSG